MTKRGKKDCVKSVKVASETMDRVVVLSTKLQTFDELLRAITNMREQTSQTMQMLLQAAGVDVKSQVTIKAREGIVEWKNANCI